MERYKRLFFFVVVGIPEFFTFVMSLASLLRLRTLFTSDGVECAFEGCDFVASEGGEKTTNSRSRRLRLRRSHEIGHTFRLICQCGADSSSWCGMENHAGVIKAKGEDLALHLGCVLVDELGRVDCALMYSQRQSAVPSFLAKKCPFKVGTYHRPDKDGLRQGRRYNVPIPSDSSSSGDESDRGVLPSGCSIEKAPASSSRATKRPRPPAPYKIMPEILLTPPEPLNSSLALELFGHVSPSPPSSPVEATSLVPLERRSRHPRWKQLLGQRASRSLRRPLAGDS